MTSALNKRHQACGMKRGRSDLAEHLSWLALGLADVVDWVEHHRSNLRYGLKLFTRRPEPQHS
ncbi:MAG TPA: hypothetical protein PLX89_15275 [Verrucomicrobiota bacterium]|nr:hypothetical protein [Verrucomicrobiales bacterium]HRI14354.1 hypothetical protein [Verrucomicrobiota bacterium]